MVVSICIWFIDLINDVWFTVKVDCHDSNRRSTIVVLTILSRIDFSLGIHTYPEYSEE